MKKSIAIIILAGSTLLMSCSVYTCPAYAKATPKKAVKETRW